ncbi:hypothetical protein FB45DRAFT_1050060 [Roridomyces roridus]|uniref:Uncharacterized protein n=1 Tax=Roridomyces roridus TaxID=1738132 RepID=A0AAD7CIK6_9AGAR|nr:hypothetical protein FB45DRAFT_1050060 [Roridomyces roridus]
MSCNSSCSTHSGLFGPLNLSSPSEELVSSNDAPSSQQVAAISSAIERAHTELARVHDALAILTAQRTELEDFIRKNDLAPLSIRLVEDVPADLLDMFFTVAHQWKEITFVNNEHFARFVYLGIEFPFLTKLVAGDFMYFGPLLPSDVPGADPVKALPALKELILMLPLLSPGTHLTLRVPDVGDGDPNPIVTNVYSLEIVHGTRRTRGDLLNVLAAPRLQNLLITHGRGEDTDPAAITAFLNNSGCTLRHLRILGCMWRDAVDILLLPAVRDIIRLEIAYLWPTDCALLFPEFERRPDRRLVPGLQTLVVRGDLKHCQIAQILANRNPVRRVYKGPFATREWKFPEKHSRAGILDLVILHEAGI